MIPAVPYVFGGFLHTAGTLTSKPTFLGFSLNGIYNFQLQLSSCCGLWLHTSGVCTHDVLLIVCNLTYYICASPVIRRAVLVLLSLKSCLKFSWSVHSLHLGSLAHWRVFYSLSTSCSWPIAILETLWDRCPCYRTLLSSYMSNSRFLLLWAAWSDKFCFLFCSCFKVHISFFDMDVDLQWRIVFLSSLYLALALSSRYCSCLDWGSLDWLLSVWVVIIDVFALGVIYLASRDMLRS